MKRLVLVALLAGAIYFAYQTFMRTPRGAGRSPAARGLERLRGHSRELDEVNRAR